MSDYISNISLIKQVGNLTAIASEDEYKISVHLPAAKADVIKIISSATYALLLDSEDDTYTAGDREKAALGEAYLALAYIIPAINNVSSGSGVVKETGFNDSRKQFLSENDIQSMVERYRDSGLRILNEYKATADADEDENPDSVRTEGLSMLAI